MRVYSLAAVVVEPVELLGDLVRAPVVLSHEQLERGVGAAQAPGRVQPWPEAEPEGPRRQLRGIKRRHLHQRPQPRPRRPPQARHTLAHDAAVLAAQRHEVADRGERGQVEVLVRARGVEPGGARAAPRTA